MEIGNRIKEIRNSLGMTQQELAEAAKIDLRTIQRIENGEVLPRSYTLKLIAKALSTDASELISLLSASQSTHSKSKLMALHLSGILLIPTLLLWYFEKDVNPAINRHGRDVINFQLTMFSVLIPCLFLPGFPQIIALFTMIVILVNASLVYKGRAYFYPLAIKILK